MRSRRRSWCCQAPERSVARAANCPSSPVTAAKLAGIDGATGLACYGGQLLTFRAFVPRLEGVGGTSNYWISPAWLDDFQGSWVYLGTSQRAASTVAFVPPALGRCLGPSGSTCPFRQYAGRWATVSAHFDGPVAQTCRYHGHQLGKGMTKWAAVEDCRQRLIVLAVGPDALPATDTMPPGTDDGPAAAPPPGAHAANCPPPPATIGKIVNTDLQSPLTCFGSALLTFRAFVQQPEGLGGTSTYRDLTVAGSTTVGAAGVDLSAVPEGPQVAAFVPPALGRCPLDDDSDCPFRPYRGHWATIRAQYDAPVAQTCRYAEKPAGGGFTKADAVDECRAKLVVLGRSAPTPARDGHGQDRAGGRADPRRVVLPLELWASCHRHVAADRPSPMARPSRRSGRPCTASWTIEPLCVDPGATTSGIFMALAVAACGSTGPASPAPCIVPSDRPL